MCSASAVREIGLKIHEILGLKARITDLEEQLDADEWPSIIILGPELEM
jgi:hypothetical protein